MPCILIVDKSGSIKELNVKTYSEDELYKKAGFKTSDGFELKTTWDVDLSQSNKENPKKYFISVYGKTKGRAGQENKYDFPPPIDNILFFGSCVLVNHPEGEEVENLFKEEWNKIYEHLFGGFEDIGSEDSEDDEDDEDEDEVIPKTKSGYAKDGFVVEDNEIESERETDSEIEKNDDSEEDEKDINKVKKQMKSKKLPKWATKSKLETIKKSRPKKKTVFDSIETDIQEESYSQNTILECSDELKEEEYV